jgi:hypothetical protein
VAVLALALGACGDDDKANVQTQGEVGLTDTGGPTVAPGDCAGLKNGIGVTDSKITIANASDISGIVPGLFKDAQQAVQAYVAYFNAGKQTICGRKLEYLPLDSRLDAAGDQQAAQQACEKAFAMIGSMSAFDSGGAAATSGCGIPDLRVATVTPARLKSKTTYAVNSLAVNLVPGVVPQYFLQNHHDATQHAAFLYLNAGSGLANGKSQIAAYKKAGYKFIYEQAIDPLDVNYTPYILAMKKQGRAVRPVHRGLQLRRAPGQGDGGAAVQARGLPARLRGLRLQVRPPRRPAGDGTRLFTNSALLEEAKSNEEMRRYIGWLGKVAPNAYPTYFGMFAWSAARLFTEQAIQLGGKLDRASFLEAHLQGRQLGRARPVLAAGDRQADDVGLHHDPAPGEGQVGPRVPGQVHLRPDHRQRLHGGVTRGPGRGLPGCDNSF